MAKTEDRKDELFFVELGWQAQKGDLAIEWRFEEYDILRNSPLKDFYNPVLFHQRIGLLLEVARAEFLGEPSNHTILNPDESTYEDEDDDALFDFGNFNSFLEVVSDGFLSSTDTSLEIHEQLFYYEIGAFGFCKYLSDYLKTNYNELDPEIENYISELNQKAILKIESFSKYGNLDNSQWYNKLNSLQIYSIHDVLSGLMTIEDENNLHLQQLLSSREELNQAIEAASDLQNALLPLYETLCNAFNEVFTYNKPKFKVGGDFYFFHNEGDTKIVACCDCTGHGVRAAMLSVLLNKFLYQQIVVQRTTDPIEILRQINHHLFFFLNRNFNADKEANPLQVESTEYVNKLRDSMDISICSINEKTKEITFCSTKENIIIIEEDHTINIFDPKKFSLGDLHHQKEFRLSTMTIPYKKQVGLIFATDGIVDQFGGPKGKKLGFRRYRQLIESILEINNYQITNLSFWLDSFYYLWTDWQFTKELAEIAQINNLDCEPIGAIKEIFLNMKGGSLSEFYHNIDQSTKPRQEQVDDIMIIGFRI